MAISTTSNEMRQGHLSRAKPPHHSAPEISHCLLVHSPGVAPRSRPDPGRMLAPSDCIPDPPHCPPVPPFTTLQMDSSPVHASPGQLSLKPLSRVATMVYALPYLAAWKSGVPCSFCCISVGLDLRACSLSPGSFTLLHDSRHPCPFAELRGAGELSIHM